MIPKNPTTKKKNKKGLTTKQQRFVDFYDGNATDAARKAGYKGNANQLHAIGAQNLQKLTIKEAIDAREKKRNKKNIADREERQGFWTDVMNMNDNTVQMRDRLKASELLGKSQADFTEKVKVDSELTLNIIKRYALAGGDIQELNDDQDDMNQIDDNEAKAISDSI